VPLSQRSEFEDEEQMPPTNPLRFAHSKQVVAAWAWVFCALDLVIPTIFYLGLSLGYHAPGETNRVAIRDYFLLRLGLAAVAMGHLKLSTHAEGRSPRRVRMGAVAVSILTFVFGIVTFLIVYLLMLRVTFGSSVSDVADVDQLGWGVSAPGFGYIGDCESSSRALSHAPSAVPCPVPCPVRRPVPCPMPRPPSRAPSRAVEVPLVCPVPSGGSAPCVPRVISRRRLAPTDTHAGITGAWNAYVDCTSLSDSCIDLSAVEANPSTPPTLRFDCPHTNHNAPSSAKPPPPPGERLVPFFSHYVEQQTRGFDVSHAWGEEISQMLTARWTWSWDFWPEYWRERLEKCSGCH
jgi:hypothetical protein